MSRSYFTRNRHDAFVGIFVTLAVEELERRDTPAGNAT